MLRSWKTDPERPTPRSVARLVYMRDRMAELPFGFVPGVGPSYPKAVIVGEAPGATEVQLGAPFVGRAGQRLETFLGSLLTDCWVTNVSKTRPTRADGRDRPPTDEEVHIWLPYLWHELILAAGHSTRVICALGRTAASALCGEEVSVYGYHGKWRVVSDLQGVEWALFVTFHPSAALRNPEVNKMFAEDLAVFSGELGKYGQQVFEALNIV